MKFAAAVFTVAVMLFEGLHGWRPQGPRPVGHAVQVAPVDVFGDKLCPDGCVYQESPGYYLALRIGPGGLHQQFFSARIPYEMHVTRISGWIGTPFNSEEENAAQLEIIKPNGDASLFWIEQDKHQDVEGEVMRDYTVNITLPAGTIITLEHHAAGALGTNQGMDTIWRLYTE